MSTSYTSSPPWRLHGGSDTALSFPSQKFFYPPCWYYRLQEIETHEFEVTCNSITCISNLIKVRLPILDLNHVDGHDQPCMH
jgi:hypothetical protein